MFVGVIDLFLHLIAICLTYIFFGSFDAKVYIAFAVIHLLLIWLAFGDFVDFLEKAPLGLVNFITNIISVGIFVPALAEFGESKILKNSKELLNIKDALSKPPTIEGSYYVKNVCEVCSKEEVVEQANLIQGYIDVW